jgi:uncharacterized protein involved in exopolysaccharide biosynthesis
MARIGNDRLAGDLLLTDRVSQAQARLLELESTMGGRHPKTVAARQEYQRLRRQLVARAADYLV